MEIICETSLVARGAIVPNAYLIGGVIFLFLGAATVFAAYAIGRR